MPFSIEKWYLDTFLPDGSLLILTIGQARLLGMPLGRLSVEWHPPDGTVVRESSHLGRLAAVGRSYRFRSGLLEDDRIRWHGAGTSGDLRFHPRYPPAALRDPLMRFGNRTLTWVMDVPDAVVEGDLTIHGRTMAVRGRGYRDHVVMTALPTQMRGWDLRWGRAVSQSHATAWIRLHTPEGTVEGTWHDGRVGPVCISPPLHEERIIGESLVADLPAMRIGPLRSLLSTLAGHPLQRRMLAAGTLDGEPAQVLHEVVRWG